MGFTIEGPLRGTAANVNREGLLTTRSLTNELQYYYSKEKGQVYQVVGDETALTNTTQTILHLRNNSNTKYLVISYIRLQAIDLAGGTAPPSAANYFQVGLGTSYSSGGTAVTPVNVNASSGNAADATAYDDSPTVTGTFSELDRWYLKEDAGVEKYNKHGSIILGKNDTFEVRFTTDNTSGYAYARITFSMIDVDET